MIKMITQEWKKQSNLLIFVLKVNNIQPLSQMLEESAIWNQNNEQVKIKSKSSIVYVNILQEAETSAHI
jgi:hypothetical protein